MRMVLLADPEAIDDDDPGVVEGREFSVIITSDPETATAFLLSSEETSQVSRGQLL